jgi:hypothetical protein
MMDEAFLTDAEVKRLAGCRHRTEQIAALRQMGIPFWVNAAGRPIVVRAIIEGRSRQADPKPVPAWTPKLAVSR